MTDITRRDFLRACISAAALAGLPSSMGDVLAAAQELPANNANGSIKDVEHVVILMLENRSFDTHSNNHNQLLVPFHDRWFLGIVYLSCFALVVLQN